MYNNSYAKADERKPSVIMDNNGMQDINNGSARQEPSHSLFSTRRPHTYSKDFFDAISIKGLIRSIGSGKIVVEFFSAATSVRVCR
jgi:hypothetical protein